MKCMHCLVEFHEENDPKAIGQDVDGIWELRSFRCPACARLNLFLVNRDPGSMLQYGAVSQYRIISSVPIRPRGSSRPPCPKEVPAEIAEDYKEACLVLPDSAKASAALSRRCLQNLLREAAKVKPGKLADEIQEVLDSRSLPSHLAEAIDGIRQIGNFAAHPTKSTNTGEIISVEAGEAEWNLDVLEGLFDFYYVQPAKTAQKRAALNEKLKDAGKPPMK